MTEKAKRIELREPVFVFQDPAQSIAGAERAFATLDTIGFEPIIADHELDEREQAIVDACGDLAASIRLASSKPFKDDELPERFSAYCRAKGEAGERLRGYVAYLMTTDTPQREEGWKTVVNQMQLKGLEAFNAGTSEEMPEVEFGNRDLYGIGKPPKKLAREVRRVIFDRTAKTDDPTELRQAVEIAERKAFGEPVEYFSNPRDVHSLRVKAEKNTHVLGKPEAVRLLDRLREIDITLNGEK